MPDEKTQRELLSEANKIIKDIQEEVARLKKEGKLNPSMNKALNKIKKDTKNLINRYLFMLSHQPRTPLKTNLSTCLKGLMKWQCCFQQASISN